MAYCERADSQHYKDHFEAGGYYECAQCGNELFHAKSKYKHHTPWPAFTETMKPDSVKKIVETEPQSSSSKPAMKLLCGKCDNPVGHEFIGDGPEGKGSRF